MTHSEAITDMNCNYVHYYYMPLFSYLISMPNFVVCEHRFFRLCYKKLKSPGKHHTTCVCVYLTNSLSIQTSTIPVSSGTSINLLCVFILAHSLPECSMT